MSMIIDGSNGVTFPDASTETTSDGNKLTSGTAQASTSGTSIDFTGIPSWVKRVTVMLSGVSFSGTDNLYLRIGDSGGISSTGYSSDLAYIHTVNTVGVSSVLTTAFSVGSWAAGGTYSGTYTLTLVNSSTNSWVCTFILLASSEPGVIYGAGTKSLSSSLDRVRILPSGSNTFDAGTINILYE